MTQRRRLSAGEIAEMRRLFDAGHLIADLIKAYGVHRSVVDRDSPPQDSCGRSRRPRADHRDEPGVMGATAQRVQCCRTYPCACPLRRSLMWE